MTGDRSKWIGHTHYSSVRVVLCVASMASVWALVSAQAAAPTASTYSPCPRRDLPTTVWGFLLTLVALTVDYWGSHKNEDDNIYWKVATVILMCILNPFVSWDVRMESLMDSRMLMRRMSSTPAAKSYIKILSACSVLVNLESPAAVEKLRHLHTFKQSLEVEDLSDALVIGRRVPAQNLLQLSVAGKEVLLKADILPPVEQLKVLQGYSGLAVAASAIQGVGYMYGIVVRLAQGLHVSPLEAIAFMLNLIVLGKAILHLYSSSCHRPLLLVLELDEEVKFTTMCEVPEASWRVALGEELKFSMLSAGGIAIIPEGVLIFFIIQITNTISFTATIPLIIIEGAILLVVCIIPLRKFDLSNTEDNVLAMISFVIIPIMNFVGYVYGCVATIKYWESREFNIRSSNYLAQILPYLG